MYSKKYLDSKILKDDVIFLHGGGNFGDLYRTEMKLRSHILRHFPNNKFIIFPQTINYRNTSLIETDLPDYTRIRDLTIMTRSAESFEFAKNKMFKNQTTKIILVPDMAFMIGPIEPSHQTPIFDILVMRRTDKEKNYTDDKWLHLLKQKISTNWSYKVKLIFGFILRVVNK